MAGNAIKAFRAKGQAKKTAKRRAKTDLPHGSYSKLEMFRGKEIIPKEFKAKKRLSFIGLGRTKKGRTPRSPGVPFERGSMGLRKKTRSSSRKSGRK